MSNGKKDDLIVRVPWEFDSNVASVFEDMISRSIPGYANLRYLISQICLDYLNRSDVTTFMDLGCSTGIQIGEFLSIDSAVNNFYIGLDKSKDMVAVATKNYLEKPNVRILNFDLINDENLPKCDVALSLFTIQFITIENRLSVLKKIHSAIEPNGFFIMMEKILGRDSFSNEYLIDKYHQSKSLNGYTTDQIMSKSIALTGILVPLSLESNIDLLQNAGFKSIEIFWLNLNFVGLIAWK